MSATSASLTNGYHLNLTPKLQQLLQLSASTVPYSLPPFSHVRTRVYLRQVIVSALPFVAFLVVYGLNGVLRLLPAADDIDCTVLHNVSWIEYRTSVWGRPIHELLSGADSGNLLLDVLSALPYLSHYTLPIAFPLHLIFVAKRPEKVVLFYWLLGWTTWIYFFIWFLLPTAPPWLANQVKIVPTPLPQRLSSLLDLKHREGCTFGRFDSATGFNLFRKIFSSNPVPFASFPSGHVAWPMCIQRIATFDGRLSKLVLVYIVWVAWATMYSCHHFFIDIVGAVVIVCFVDLVLKRRVERLTHAVVTMSHCNGLSP